MRRLLVALVLFAACQRQAGPVPASASTSPQPVGPPTEQLAAEVAIARSGCVRCHVATGDLAPRLAVQRGPALDEAVRWRAADAGAAFLQRHHGGVHAADLAAWIAALGAAAPVAVVSDITPVAQQRGETLFHELACGACHATAALEELATRTDHARVAAFLRDPAAHRPDRVHLAVTATEANDLAAWLLRAQQSVATTAPGFAFACFERQVNEAGLPELGGAVPSAQGIADHLGADLGTRDHHFVLRFEAMLDVPSDGEWTFTTGSDDSSWLWIDDQLVVRNEALAPHRRAKGSVTLTAGAHALRVMYSQAAGERTLEVLWQGPGIEQQVLPVERATAARVQLTPPSPPPVPAADAVARGREVAQQQRCDACHAIADESFHPAPPSARPFAELRDGVCPEEPAAQALWAGARTPLAHAADAATKLGVAMLRDGCLSCHTRDGRGGLPPIVQQSLTVVEDVGDEGRLPPDLGAVGRRLRAAWIEKVLREGHKVRPYLRVRMPQVAAERAHDYADWFAAVDGGAANDVEPVFAAAAAQHGRELVGIGARNCITCHTCQGHRSLGIQGMDFAIQYERLRPSWLRDWLLRPTELRPKTRMPALWWRRDEADLQEIDAIVAWLSLGAAAPLPKGLPSTNGLLLEPVDRVLLHGAFLKGLSARCLAVGTPERANYAFDLTAARLAWIWRGAFLDASGTWEGRAGRLLEPKGEQWIVLDDVAIAGGAARRMLGRRIAADGHPILRVAVGDAEYEDDVVPRLERGGSLLVRTLHCVGGHLQLEFPAATPPLQLTVGGHPAGKHELAAGQSLEVVYSW